MPRNNKDFQETLARARTAIINNLDKPQVSQSSYDPHNVYNRDYSEDYSQTHAADAEMGDL
jgi:hypothetical protein